MTEDFKVWAYQLWERNCEEHEGYGEQHVSFNEYLRENREFLKKEYQNKDASK